MEKIQPEGIFLVGVMTVLTALEVGLFALLYWFGRSGESYSLRQITEAGLIGGFGVLLLMDAVLIFRSKRTGYYLSMALWIVLFSAVCYYDYRFFSAGAYFMAFGALLNVYNILYPIICLVYFLRKNVRTYFCT